MGGGKGGGGEKYTWVLDVFLEKYYLPGVDLSTVHPIRTKDGKSINHPTKNKDGFHPSFSIHGKVGDKQEELIKKRKQQQEKDVVVSVDQGEDQKQTQDSVEIEGFTTFENQDVNKALGAAAKGQRDAFCNEVAAMVAAGWVGIRSRVGWARSLAGKAARGVLSTTRAAPSVEPVPTESPAAICAAQSIQKGKITGPDGVVAIAALGQNGQLRNGAGVLFSISDSAKFWSSVLMGELDFTYVS